MNTATVYTWSVPVYRVDAQVAGKELERIHEKNGVLKPADVVEESRGPDAPLHGCFEWDDRKAAEGYRRRQARDIIINIVTVKVGPVEAPTPVRAFVGMRRDNAYIPVSQVLAQKELRGVMLENALRDLEAFRRRYDSLCSLGDLMERIDAVIAAHNAGCGRPAGKGAGRDGKA